MGLDSTVDENLLKINGGNQLKGNTVTALDLRAGIALTLAGLFAEGETNIQDAWQITRGYDQFINKMNSLGATLHPTYKK